MGEHSGHTMVLRVQGMSCTGCEERIGRVLSRLEGVRETAADHRSGEVRVAIDPELVAAESLAERIERAGYQVISTEEVAS